MLPDDLRTPLPEVVDDRKVATVLTEYQRLVAERTAASAELVRREDARRLAVEADQQALADALRGGKPDPGEEATRKADAAILAQRRRAEALAIAVADHGREVVAVVDRQRASWSAKLDDRVSDARRELAVALDAVGTAHSLLAEALATRSWLADFPGRSRWPVTFVAFAPGLAGRNGEDHAVVAVLAALRSLTEAPAPMAPPRAVPLVAVPRAS